MKERVYCLICDAWRFFYNKRCGVCGTQQPASPAKAKGVDAVVEPASPSLRGVGVPLSPTNARSTNAWEPIPQTEDSVKQATCSMEDAWERRKRQKTYQNLRELLEAKAEFEAGWKAHEEASKNPVEADTEAESTLLITVDRSGSSYVIDATGNAYALFIDMGQEITEHDFSPDIPKEKGSYRWEGSLFGSEDQGYRFVGKFVKVWNP